MKSFALIQKHIKSYLKLHLKNKPCSPIPSPMPPGPPLPASPASLTPVSGFALNGPSAAPLLSPRVNPLRSLLQPGTRGAVLSLPGPRGGGQERASSKKHVSGKEEGEEAAEEGTWAAASGQSTFCCQALLWPALDRGPQRRRPQDFNSSLSCSVSLIRTTTGQAAATRVLWRWRSRLHFTGECIMRGLYIWISSWVHPLGWDWYYRDL